MKNFHVVLGCNGPLGVELMATLHARGEDVRGVCRSGRSEAPKGVPIVRADAADARSVEEVCKDASVVYSAIGVEYSSWSEQWPAIVTGLVEGVRRTGARLVFADNLYAYGPQERPLVETMPYTDYGNKPALRARLARALESSGIPLVIARASDFYGPRVRHSLLGERVFARALLGKPLQLLGDPETLHSFTYISDFARALATLGADEGAVGQSWHVPTAPAETTLAVVERISRLLSRPLRTQALKPWMLKALGLVSPTLRELDELEYQYSRPFVIDDAKFRTRYFGEPTELSRGLAATLSWYALNGRHAHAA
jgi:nucleoside-diphosphate-sugar epimerase